MTVRFPKGELNMKQKREIVKKNAARSVLSGKNSAFKKVVKTRLSRKYFRGRFIFLF